MKDRSKYVKLGGFITAGVVLFTLAIYYIGSQQNLFGSTFRISGIFQNVGGLQVGNNVRYSGINVGTVENIEIESDTSVRVDMIVELKVKQFIKTDSKASIGSEGLMGNRVVNIIPGTPGGKEIERGGLILTSKPVDMDEIIINLQKTTENVSVMTEDLSFILKKVKNGEGSIGKLVMDDEMANSLQQTLNNIESGTKGFSQNMEAAKSNILLRGYYKKQEKKKERQKDKKEEEKPLQKIPVKPEGNKSDSK